MRKAYKVILYDIWNLYCPSVSCCASRHPNRCYSSATSVAGSSVNKARIVCSYGSKSEPVGTDPKEINIRVSTFRSGRWTSRCYVQELFSRFALHVWFMLVSQTRYQLKIFGEERDRNEQGRKASADTSPYAVLHPKLVHSSSLLPLFWLSLISPASLLSFIPIFHGVNMSFLVFWAVDLQAEANIREI
jgi:hypothetical protein